MTSGWSWQQGLVLDLKPFPSWLLLLSENNSSSKTFLMKMNLICMKLNLNQMHCRNGFAPRPVLRQRQKWFFFSVAKASVKDPVMLTWNVRGIAASFQCFVCCLNSNSTTLVFNLVARRLRVVDDISLFHVFITCFLSVAINSWFPTNMDELIVIRISDVYRVFRRLQPRVSKKLSPTWNTLCQKQGRR